MFTFALLHKSVITLERIKREDTSSSVCTWTKGGPGLQKVELYVASSPRRVSGRYLKPQRSECEGLPLNLECNSAVWKPT